MPIEVACRCGQRFAAEPHLAGQQVNCPFCGSPLAIPAAAAPQAAAPQAAAPAGDTVRCKFCHQYVPHWEYDQHVQQHLALQPDGQHTDYATLPPEERVVTPEFEAAPRWYRHRKCGEVTGMPEEIIQTYLQDPWFYLADNTFCSGCGKHVRLNECVWEETGEDLQTYTDRLRAAKPQLRPGLLKRMLVAVLNMFG